MDIYIKKMIILCLIVALGVIIKKSTRINIKKEYSEEEGKSLSINIEIGNIKNRK